MSSERVSTDKIRFHDDITNFVFEPDTPFIHTIEISDERSDGHFISFYVTGLSRWVRDLVGKWKPMVHNHDPKLYHRESKDMTWIIDHFGQEKATPSWSEHYHFHFTKQPGHEEINNTFKIFGNAVSNSFKNEILDELNQRNKKCQ